MLPLIAGGLLPLSLSPFHYYPLGVVSLALLFFSWDNATAKQAALRGFLFGIGMFGVGISWIYVAIHQFGQASVALAVLMTALFVSFMASYLAVLGWLVKQLSNGEFSSRDTLLLLPVAWVFFEWFKSWFLTGLAWLEVGTGQIDGPLSGYIPVVGSLGVSLLVAVSASLLVLIWKRRSWQSGLTFIALWFGGYGMQSAEWTFATGDEMQVSIIQNNVPQELKWNKEQLFKTLALYQARTEENWQSDLIVWPENAITVFHHQVKAFYLDPLAKLAKENDTALLLGLPVQDEKTGDYYNAMVAIEDEQEAFYYKNHLVPFGDYVPFEWLRGVVAFFDLPMSSFRPGAVSDELIRVAGQTLGISICYEDIFSTEILRNVPEARILVNATNNAWYGDSFAPHQHLQMSQNRALETGRPIVRATTNGISAFIDFKGHLKQQSAQFQEVVLTDHVQARQGATPYAKWGRLPLFLGSLFMLMLWLLLYRQVDRNKRAN